MLPLRHRDADSGRHSVSRLLKAHHIPMRACSKSIMNQRRRSPGGSSREKLSAWLVLATCLGAVVMVVIFTTGSRRATSLVFGFLIGAGWMVSVARSRKLGTLAAARPGESICQF